MLLVHDREAEVGELDILLDQCMRSHDQTGVARRGRSSHPPAFRRALAAHQQLNCQAREALLEVGAEASEVLPGQDLGRGHDN